MIAESIEDAIVRVNEHIKEQADLSTYFYQGFDYAYTRLTPTSYRNGVYTLTILNPGEVISNDNS